ncbi:MAG: hypothetical protein ACLFUE_09305, partial [Desulfobacteraceae bacterium]
LKLQGQITRSGAFCDSIKFEENPMSSSVTQGLPSDILHVLARGVMAYELMMNHTFEDKVAYPEGVVDVILIVLGGDEPFPHPFLFQFAKYPFIIIVLKPSVLP